MKNIKKLAFESILLGLASSAVYAAPVTYEFDTLTSISMHGSAPSISGVLRNDSVVSTVGFADNTNISFRYVVNRCLPIFLTMIEKPGRYWLTITVDAADSNVALKACALTLRS